jgi:hypothetical protein
MGEKTPTQLGPLERSNLNHWIVSRYLPAETEQNHERPQDGLYPAEIPTEHLLNMNLERCRYADRSVRCQSRHLVDPMYDMTIRELFLRSSHFVLHEQESLSSHASLRFFLEADLTSLLYRDYRASDGRMTDELERIWKKAVMSGICL